MIATVAPQTLDEQVTRYFNDVVDHTDETLGEMYSLAMPPLGFRCYLTTAERKLGLKNSLALPTIP